MFPRQWFPRDDGGGFIKASCEMRTALISLLGLLHLLEIRAMRPCVIGAILTLSSNRTGGKERFNEILSKQPEFCPTDVFPHFCGVTISVLNDDK